MDFKKGDKVFLDGDKLSKKFNDTVKMHKKHGVYFNDNGRFSTILKLVNENEQFKITEVLYDGGILNLKGIRSKFEMSCGFEDVKGEIK